MEFKKYVEEVEAFQWFPGAEAPWPIEKSGEHYFVLHMGKDHDYGSYGPLTIFPGDYIVKVKQLRRFLPRNYKYTWMSEGDFNEIYKEVN